MREHTVPAPDNRESFELARGNLLLGGMPSSGKSVLFNLTATHTALTGEQPVPDLGSATRPEVA